MTTIRKARRHERQIADAFRSSVRAAIRSDDATTSFLPLKASISEVFLDVARVRARRINVPFDPFDADLVRYADQQGRDALRRMVADFRITGTGLSLRQETAVRNYERSLRNPDAGLLDRKLRDRRFDASVRAALRGENRLSEKRIATMVSRYRDRLLTYRARLIGQTESVRAENAAAFVLAGKAADEGRVVRRYWDHRDDARVRNSHREIPLLNPDGVGPDEPFQTPLGPLMYPGDPNGFGDNVVGCRCQLRIEVL